MMPRHPLAAWRGRIERLEHPLRRDQDAEAALSPLSLRGGRKVARHSGLISTSLHQVRPALYRSADVGLEVGPRVRILLPPAESPRTIGSCPTLQVRRRYPDSFPLLHGHEFGHCAIEHGSIRKLGTSSKAMIIESRC